jgi:hypothetical protein
MENFSPAPMTSSSPDEPMRAPPWSRRSLLAAAAAAPFLARCSSDPNSDSAGLARMVGQSFDIFRGGSAITLEQVANVPFASLGVRVGGGPQILLVLASRSGASMVWTSAAHIALEIRYGRILRTAGLPHDLTATAIVGSDPLEAGLQNLRSGAAARRTLDFADRSAFGNVVDSSLEPAGPADIDVLGTRIRTAHVVERCTCGSLAWNFTNEYWADTTAGRVWRSLQNVHPGLDALEIELFRPPNA